jgi:ribonuclease T2
MYRTCLASVLLSAFVATFATGAGAQDARQNKPGEFDFYVLSLSWSPAFCESGVERGISVGAADQQCGERSYGFVVHGFWPQYEAGFPEFCQVPAPRLDRNIVASMLDLMPAPRLVYHEWDRHGTCSGLSARAYFDNVRKARAVVKIPAEYLDVKETLTVTPDEVEEAFVKANPGLTREAISIGCDNRRLREVRICLSRELAFRDCAEIDRRACRREQVVMPPVRSRTTNGSARE